MGAFVLMVLKELLPLAIEGAPGALEAIQWARERIEEMVADDRGPSEEEQAELDRRTADLRRRLHSDEE